MIKMVVRKDKKSRKHLGARRWGRGNIKNGRGAGDRGGVGNGGKKHSFTWYTAKAPELIGRPKGFVNPNRKALDYVTLAQISRMDRGEQELEFPGFKILSNGNLSRPVTIKASKFSKKAEDKIKAAGGQAIVV
jgi:large subunit ribosomal protein L15